jgi:hypothetical protein
MEVKLKQIDSNCLAESRAIWLDKATSLDMPTFDVEKTFDWAASRIDYERKGDSYAYGVLEDNTTNCLAIVDIVHTDNKGKANAWLKMLSIELRPEFTEQNILLDQSLYEAAMDIYTASIIGTIELTDVHKARTIKLYGRNDSLLSLLTALKERLQSKMHNALQVNMEGRWLVISVK